MFVLGTAGHVDHGKSTLVQALTGIDPDRLREEKERGMTIDLGFAWLPLPSGRELSIVDVPGHERFIKNMLAGVGGIDLALLVVAADEGVMPQTREHLAILDLLQVHRGLVAITKADLVEEEWLELVMAEVEETLEGTTLQGAPLYPVSAFTSRGLPELVAGIDGMLEVTLPRRDIGRPRLPVDRSFVMSGFGTVVTGTLADGVLSVGQEVELALAGKRARVRGLQTHRQRVDVAQPGTRTAVNLSGISHDEVSRGDVVTLPGGLRTALALDVYLRLIPDSPRRLRHNAAVTFYTGTHETPARVRLLDRQALEPGESGWAQLRLQDPAAVAKGDLFVLRAWDTTVGGGAVVEPGARRHRRLHAPTLERLELLGQGSGDEVILQALEGGGPCDVNTVAQRANLSTEEAVSRCRALADQGQLVSLGSGALGPTTTVLPLSLWRRVAGRVQETLERYHRQHPLRRGAPREEVRSRLGLDPPVAALALTRLIREGALVEEESWLRLPQHQAIPHADQLVRMNRFVRDLELTPYSPPSPDELEPELLSYLVEKGEVVKASEDVIFAAGVYQEMVERIVERLKGQGKITVGEVRDMFGTSRKYALALMEHMDQQRVTRRVGDERVLR